MLPSRICAPSARTSSGRQRLDGRLRPDGHEHGRRHDPVRRRQQPGAGRAFASRDAKRAVGALAVDGGWIGGRPCARAPERGVSRAGRSQRRATADGTTVPPAARPRRGAVPGREPRCLTPGHGRRNAPLTQGLLHWPRPRSRHSPVAVTGTGTRPFAARLGPDRAASEDEHRVAEGVEAVALLDGEAVEAAGLVDAGEGHHERQQRRPRQVEVRQQAVDALGRRTPA